MTLSIINLIGCTKDSTEPTGKSEDIKETSETGKSGGSSKSTIDTPDKFKEMYSNPEKFKKSNIEFVARIFLEPEIDGQNTYFQCYAYNNDNLNTLVSVESVLDLEDGDIVLIKGKVKDKFDTENAFGAEMSLAAIVADSVEKTDYASAFSPAIEVIDLNKEIDQHGYLMKVDKVEFSEDETRIYVTINNNTDSNISFYSFDAKVVQGSSQLKEVDTYDKGYEEIESDILPGVIEKGVIVFAKSNPKEPLKIYLEGSSDNYDLDFEPFIFETE